jgi:hypothetical protein
MSVRNGHYECTCYHPLFVFNQFCCDLERCAFRGGNVHGADGWGRAEAGRGALSWQALAHLFPRRRRIRQSMHIPNPSGSNTPFGSPPSYKSGSATC